MDAINIKKIFKNLSNVILSFEFFFFFFFIEQIQTFEQRYCILM